MKLSETSKMGKFASWGLPAGSSCPSSKIKGSICEKCYAKKGFYRFRNPKNVREKRFLFVLKSLREDNGEVFINTMKSLLSKYKQEKFRIHDSGDFFNEKYVECWIEICKAFPHIKFWAPTREWRGKALKALKKLNKLSNVTVRPSAIFLGDDPPKVKGLAAGTTVSQEKMNIHNCPATFTDKKSCESNNCFVCWDKTTEVNYHKH